MLEEEENRLMTKRLFDFDGYLLRFCSRVVSCEKDARGYAVVLEETAFAPEGGGQRSDIGTLNGANVLDVCSVGDCIVHITDVPLGVGQTVCGEVDRDRRMRHLQNHSGEHIVSGLIHSRYGYDNVGFHLGSEDVTIDISGVLDEPSLREIEREANEVVVRNLPIEVAYPSPEALKSLCYRAKLDLSENVRIVTIDGVDACACCAPHVARTGEIGMIKLLFAIKYKGGTRIHMKCGFDALEEFNAEYARATAISNRISLPRERIAEGVDKLWEDLSSANFRLVGLKRELIALKAQSAVAEEGSLLFVEQGFDAAELRLLVSAAEGKVTGQCAAFSRCEDGSYAFVAMTRCEDFSAWQRALFDALHARGGGKPPYIQGKAACTEEEIRAFFRANA